MNTLPTYNQTEHKLLKPGTYLGLFHGRATKEENLDDWGTNGPIIGPLEYCHTTYGDITRFRLRDDVDREAHAALLGDSDLEQDFCLEDGMLKIGGVFYGDWTVFEVAAPSELTELIDYVLESEADDFHEQLTNDNVGPLDTTDKGQAEWAILRDEWDSAKEYDGEASLEVKLALKGGTHIFCTAMRLNNRFFGPHNKFVSKTKDNDI